MRLRSKPTLILLGGILAVLAIMLLILSLKGESPSDSDNSEVGGNTSRSVTSEPWSGAVAG